jgi:hypothetical protein
MLESSEKYICRLAVVEPGGAWNYLSSNFPFIFGFNFKVLRFRLKTLRIFILSPLRGCSMHIQIFWKQQPLQFFVPIGESKGQVNSYLMILSLADLLVPRRSVHRQTNHATIQPTLSIHATIRWLWQFASVTFWLKVDGLFVHPKIEHFVLKTWTGCHVETLRPTILFYPKVGVILSRYFLSNFAVTFCPYVIQGTFFWKFGHFYSLSHVITDPQRSMYEVNDKPQLRQDIA